MRSIFFNNSPKQIPYVYAPETMELLKNIAGLETETVYSSEYVLDHPNDFQDVDFLFSTWGMPKLTEDEIKKVFPKV